MSVIRRNTSVDESYEWDSADACVDLEVLEAIKFDHSQMGFGKVTGELRYDRAPSADGLQDQQRKGESCLFHIHFVHKVTLCCMC